VPATSDLAHWARAGRINDLIRSGSFGIDPDDTPFLCECAEPRCWAVVWLSPREFDDRRRAGVAVAGAGHMQPMAPSCRAPKSEGPGQLHAGAERRTDADLAA
jgi:hypothetical protein